jgi:hypothetical protein
MVISGHVAALTSAAKCRCRSHVMRGFLIWQLGAENEPPRDKPPIYLGGRVNSLGGHLRRCHACLVQYGKVQPSIERSEIISWPQHLAPYRE